MSKMQIAILAALFVVLAVLMIIFFTGGEGESLKHLSGSPPQVPETDSPVLRMVTLFFLSEDDALFHPEEREIPAGPSVANEIERTLAELIKGSDKGLIAPLPAEAAVRQAFVTKEGVAYVDFTKAITDSYAYGSSSETSAIYAVVNTVAFNFKPVKRVFILVDGAEKETLGGHIDLSRPFSPQYSLVAR